MEAGAREICTMQRLDRIRDDVGEMVESDFPPSQGPSPASRSRSGDHRAGAPTVASRLAWQAGRLAGLLGLLPRVRWFTTVSTVLLCTW